MPTQNTLSATEARALTVRAQGFGKHYDSPTDVLRHLGVIQLDSVNVVTRSHEIVPFSRMGPFEIGDLYRDLYENRQGFEYWAHAASWLPMEEYRYFLHRMQVMREKGRGWSIVNTENRDEHADLYAQILGRIREEGPLGTGAFEDTRGHRGTWWDWKPAKRVLEDLFDQGVITAGGRGKGFERIYDLPERVLPAHLDTEDPGPEAAVRYLMKKSIEVLGVSTAKDAADYFRCQSWPAPWKEALQHLIADGEVVEVAVEGWKQKGLTTPKLLAGPITMPEHRPTFLSPFDNLIWERKRVERLWDFAFKLEIYVPQPKRVYGYYVLPLLANGRLCGRADLKFDRKAGELAVLGIWLEDDTYADAALALQDLAAHLGAHGIRVEKDRTKKAADELTKQLGQPKKRRKKA